MDEYTVTTSSKVHAVRLRPLSRVAAGARPRPGPAAARRRRRRRVGPGAVSDGVKIQVPELEVKEQ